jgi:uncharacterized protein YutE (UPF0331/DUF86 family)
MVFSEAFVLQKLTTLTEYTDRLESIVATTSDEEFEKDLDKRYVAERLMQLIVDCMIDINQHFIKEHKLELPDDLRSTFVILGDHDIIPKELAEKLAPVTGLRNILVHQYEKIDLALFLKSMRENLSDFSEYKKHIIASIDKL